MYLQKFEEIVAATVVQLDGPADWALPYWNYSADQNARLLLAAFRQPLLPDGSVSALYVEERDPKSNAGLQFATSRDTALRTALVQTRFSDPVRGNFGGLQTAFSHSGSDPGQLEGTPHGTMHVAVGGNNGWMSAFNTAALDPIFWLHHCNLDRLWQVWLDRNPGNLNPTSSQWLSVVPFSFYDAARQVTVMRCQDVVDTNTLGYSYDDVHDPLAPLHAPALGLTEMDAPMKEMRMTESIPPELVGATGSFNLQNDPVHVTVPTTAHADARERLGLAAGLPDDAAPPSPRVFLKLENMTAVDRANSYDVYVYVPEEEQPTEHPELFAGRLSMFGVAETSRSNDRHAGSGLTVTLDITDIYDQLSTQEGWDPGNIRVSLVPVREWEGAVVKVGRVSVFFG